MKTLLRWARGCGILTILACSRFLYVQLFHNIRSVEDGFGEALDPLNQAAMLAFVLFGAATVIFLLLAGFRWLVDLYDRKHPLPEPDHGSTKR